MYLCVFEDNLVSNLYPLTYFRPAYALRCGAMSLREKILAHFPGATLTLHARSYLSDYLQERHPGAAVNQIKADRCLFVNGRVLADARLVKQITVKSKEDLAFVQGDTVVAAWVSGSHLEMLGRKLADGPLRAGSFDGLPRRDIEARLIQYPWDLLSANGDEIVSDIRILSMRTKKRVQGKIHPGVRFVNSRAIYVGKHSTVMPGAVLDAESGPIYVDDDVHLYPNAVVEGPAFVGRGSAVKIGAKIYGKTSIGSVCKVGGEVEGSIIHSFANKQHEGFLGHSYLCPWVNLGADTNTSDLKNDYGPVKLVINGERVDSDQMLVGLFMGDHSKSGINTMFDTGTVVGVCCNLYGSGAPPKFVPSFSWGGRERLVEYRLAKSLEVAARVMGRRGVPLSPAYESTYRTVFELTAGDRERMRVFAE